MRDYTVDYTVDIPKNISIYIYVFTGQCRKQIFKIH